MIGPKSAAALQAFIDGSPEIVMPEKADIVKMMGLLASVKRRRQNSDAEVDAQFELYSHGLRDVPLRDLHHAYDVLLKGSPWFPDISEIREAAKGGPVAAYRRRCLIAQSLIDKHKREWVAPIADEDRPTQEQIDRVVSEFGLDVNDRPRELRMPTDEELAALSAHAQERQR